MLMDEDDDIDKDPSTFDSGKYSFHIDTVDQYDSDASLNDISVEEWDESKIGEPHLDCADFKKMSNLCSLNLGDSSFGNYCQLKKILLSFECTAAKLSNFGIKTRLVHLPPTICKLKSLPELDLTGCSEFEDFPEILEPMKDMKFLSLKVTAVKELLSAIECLFSLIKIELTNCKRFTSLPTSICKLKSLTLNLSGCYEFEDFPEILEPMKDMKIFSLKGTPVKELPSSIECLFGRIRIELKNCKRLASLPTSICKLKSHQELDLTGCSEFEDYSEILEPISSSLQEPLVCPKEHLQFKPSNYSELSGTMIESIPANIKQVSWLFCLSLINCKSLQSLPELPLKLYSLKAHGCTLLNIVSSPRTALTHGLDGYNLFPGFNQELIFSNCLKLDQITWNHIMADAQLRIMHLAFASSKFDKFEVASYAELSKEIEVAADVELEAEFEDASDVEFSEEIEVASDVGEIEVASNVRLSLSLSLSQFCYSIDN
ncbi:unnamed protein product [Prunus armeniaca]